MTVTRGRLSAEERRAGVLETACLAFAKAGYQGATTAEIARAKKEGGAFGTKVLCETLRRVGVGYVTDTARRSATDEPTFDAAWRDVAARVEPS